MPATFAFAQAATIMRGMRRGEIGPADRLSDHLPSSRRHRDKPPACVITSRNYDYLLGGMDHFAIDRETMEVGLRSWPGAQVYARENRKFLARTVEYLTREADIRQFLDIGTGLPSENNVHP
jgi:S-adenosyl methyltransferase